MDISPINITNLLPEMNSTAEQSVKNSYSKSKDESLVFEEVMNKLLTTELLKPIFASGLFSGQQQYGMLMQESLIEHFNQNLDLLSRDTGETK